MCVLDVVVFLAQEGFVAIGSRKLLCFGFVDCVLLCLNTQTVLTPNNVIFPFLLNGVRYSEAFNKKGVRYSDNKKGEVFRSILLKVHKKG